MNRKFINAFFAAALLLGGATVFSSCKDTNEDMRTELEADIAKNKAEQAALQKRLSDLETKIGGIDFQSITDNIAKLLKLEGLSKGLLNAIDQQISALEERANVSVTSVVLQSVENPVFGSVSLPIDMKTNMLLTYYGGFDEMNFPNTKAVHNIGEIITETVKDSKTVGGDVTSITKDAEGNVVKNYVGTVYTTINPSSVDATSEDIKWSLVNSQDENYGGIELQGVKLSDKVLEFGIGSRAAGNGFYEATAVASNLDEIKYDIVDGLAEDVKDALTNHSKQDAKDLIQLVIAQLRKNDFPALGVKAAYSWNDVTFAPKLDGQQWVLDGNVTETPQSAAAYSEYAIAAAAIKPLSFNFLAGQSLDKLPAIPDLGDYELSKEDFDINISYPNEEAFKANISFGEDGDIVFTVPGQEITTETDNGDQVTITVDPVEITASDLEDLQKKMQTSMQESMTGTYNEIVKMINDINNQIDNVFKKVNDKIASATDRVQPWIDRANRVINKVNSLLKNPNHYLQVCALYDNDGKIGRMSNTSAVPTYFPGGGASTLNVILTTYNLETICPAYMKYYAVYKDGASDPVAYDIIPGTQSRVAISGLEDGAKYKVVYQALDYHGVTSTQKFYFQIGE